MYVSLLFFFLAFFVARRSPRFATQGEFWVMLHRSMADYVHKSPDNQARMLLTYFSGMMVRVEIGRNAAVSAQESSSYSRRRWRDNPGGDRETIFFLLGR